MMIYLYYCNVIQGNCKCYLQYAYSSIIGTIYYLICFRTGDCMSDHVSRLWHTSYIHYCYGSTYQHVAYIELVCVHVQMHFKYYLLCHIYCTVCFTFKPYFLSRVIKLPLRWLEYWVLSQYLTMPKRGRNVYIYLFIYLYMKYGL